MKNISAHITFEEATHTSTGLKNLPDLNAINNMTVLAEKVFEPLRAYFGVPIRINSMYRSQAVNKAVGGSPTSQHTLGQAMDLDAGDLNIKIWDYITNHLVFDQAIYEFGDDAQPDWVHVSYRTGANRKQKLRSIKKNGKTIYLTV